MTAVFGPLEVPVLRRGPSHEAVAALQVARDACAGGKATADLACVLADRVEQAVDRTELYAQLLVDALATGVPRV